MMATLATQTALEEPITSDLEELILCDIEEPIISVASSPTDEQIATLAYAYWLDGGCREGVDEEDWLRAEQELIANR
jgi:hypothetical protein